MTRDEIMQIANDTAGAYWMDEAHIQRFAAALLAAEREALVSAVRFADNGTEAAEIIRARGKK